MRRAVPIKVSEHSDLEVETLRDRFDDDVAVVNLGDVIREAQPGERAVGFLRAELAAFDTAADAEPPELDVVAGPSENVRRDVVTHHVVARDRHYLSNAGTHHTGADHTYAHAHSLRLQDAARAGRSSSSQCDGSPTSSRTTPRASSARRWARASLTAARRMKPSIWSHDRDQCMRAAIPHAVVTPESVEQYRDAWDFYLAD